MLNVIINSIRQQEILEFKYSGLVRTVEPHAVGVSTTGKDVLSCYQIAGSHVTPGHDWDLCSLSKIEDLQRTGRKFSGPREGYRRNDSRMRHIYEQL